MGGVKAAFVREAIKSHNASMLASLLKAHCDDDILAAWAFIGSYHDTSAGSASVVALRDVIQKHISGKFALDIDGVQLTERALRYVSGLDQDTSPQAELDRLYKLRCKEYPGKHPGGYGRDSSAPRQRTEFPDRFRFADAWRHGPPSGSLAQQMTDCDISSAWERGLLGASGWFTTALFQDTKEVLDFYAAEAVARREEKARAEAEIEKIQLFYEEAEARKEEERRRREMGERNSDVIDEGWEDGEDNLESEDEDGKEDEEGEGDETSAAEDGDGEEVSDDTLKQIETIQPKAGGDKVVGDGAE
jgi:hypothetical protein